MNIFQRRRTARLRAYALLKRRHPELFNNSCYTCPSVPGHRHDAVPAQPQPEPLEWDTGDTTSYTRR